MNRIPVVKVQLVRESSYLYPSAVIHDPEDAAGILRDYLKDADREYFVVLLLNTKHKVIGVNTVSMGSLSASVVHPRETFKAAILANASSIIIGHNHPSGDPMPSREDLAVTKRLAKAGKVLDIPVLDHIVIGMESGRFVSLKSIGEIKD
jgi:DNA repair protein RadC